MNNFFRSILSRSSVNSRDSILLSRIESLEHRVKILEDENIGLINELYEVENALEARIDIFVSKFRTEWDV